MPDFGLDHASHMQSMLKDIDLGSKTYNNALKDMRGTKDDPYDMDVEFTVLTQGSWPIVVDEEIKQFQRPKEVR